MLEWWYQGELTFGDFVVKREFIDTQDRLTKINHGEKQFVYFTRMTNK